MKTEETRILLALLCGLACACGLADGPVQPQGPSGSLTLALRTEAGGFTYRLRDAVFDVTGTDTTTIATEDKPDAPVVERVLRAGAYQILLADGWRLERLSPSGFETVAAELTSANPRTFTIQAGRQSPVSFQFHVSGLGRLELSIEVVDDSVGDAGALEDAAPPAQDADAPTCTPGVGCTTNPHAACRNGVTSCTGNTVSCVDDPKAVSRDGAPCNGGVCAADQCVPLQPF